MTEQEPPPQAPASRHDDVDGDGDDEEDYFGEEEVEGDEHDSDSVAGDFGGADDDYFGGDEDDGGEEVPLLGPFEAADTVLHSHSNERERRTRQLDAEGIEAMVESWKPKPPSAIPDECATPFWAESVLQSICGLHPALGTRWPQQRPEQFAKQEPQYAVCLGFAPHEQQQDESFGPRTDAPDDEELLDEVDEADVDEADDEANDDQEGKTSSKSEHCGASVAPPRKAGRVVVVDPERATVGAARQPQPAPEEAPGSAAEATEAAEAAQLTADPELVGCARRILKAEGSSIKKAGLAQVAAACRVTRDVVDQVMRLLVERAATRPPQVRVVEPDFSVRVDVPPFSSSDVLEVAAEVVLAHKDVLFPATTMEEARIAAAHTLSAIETLQTGEMLNVLNETRHEACFHKVRQELPRDVRIKIELEEQQEHERRRQQGHQEEGEDSEQGGVPAKGMQPVRRRRKMRRIAERMPLRVRRVVDCRRYYALSKADRAASVQQRVQRDLAMESRKRYEHSRQKLYAFQRKCDAAPNRFRASAYAARLSLAKNRIDAETRERIRKERERIRLREHQKQHQRRKRQRRQQQAEQEEQEEQEQEDEEEEDEEGEAEPLAKRRKA